MDKLATWGKLLLVLALSSLLQAAFASTPATAIGTTFHVSRLGSNTDGRSWATAWNELDQINWGLIQPGDTILLDGGVEACQPIGLDLSSGQSCGMVYNTTLSVQASGAQSQPITIRLAPEEGRNGTVVIDGGVVGPKACPGYSGGYFPDYAVPSTPGSIDPARPNYAGIGLGSSQWIVVDGTKWGGIEIRNHYEIGFDFGHASNSIGRYLKIHHNRGHDFAVGVEMDWDADEVSGNTISHSEIFRNGQDGLHPKGDDFTLEYSYVHDHYCYHPDGIQGYHSAAVGDKAKALSGMVIRYNILMNHGNLVENAGWHGQGIFIGNLGDNDSWGENILIHDNLMVGVRGSGIISLNNHSTNFDIHHNTFVSIGDFGISWNQSAVAPMSVHDNIFYDIGAGSKPRLGFYLATSDGKTTFADNCVYLAGPESGDINEWGTIRQDPLFVDISNGDYALHGNSPCLGKGTSITSVAQLLDATPPTAWISDLPSESECSNVWLSWDGSDPAPGTGVKSFDVQVSDNGGAWTDWLLETPARNDTYPGGTYGHTLGFRVRARDQAGNVGGYSAPRYTSVIDTIPPYVARMVVLPRAQKPPFGIYWWGADACSSVTFDVEYRVGASRTWMPWLTATSDTHAVFDPESPQYGQPYTFRVRVRDEAGNSTVSDPVSTILSRHTLSGDIVTIRHEPVIWAQVTVTDAVATESYFGHYIAYLVDEGDYELLVARDGFGTLPPMHLTSVATSLSDLDFALPPHDDAVDNGGFEVAGWGGWLPGGTVVPTVISGGHTGDRAARLGGAGGLSWLHQVLSVRGELVDSTLSFLVRLDDTVAGTSALTVELAGTPLNHTQVVSTADWTHVWLPVDAAAGQAVTLTFTISDNSALRLDEVSLGSAITGGSQVQLPLVLRSNTP